MKNQLAEIRIGSRVYCTDGRAGTVERVVISPRRRAVTHLIVAQGFLLHKHVVVPIERVMRVDEDRVYLDVSSRELNQFPEYREVDYIVPDFSWQPLEQHEPSRTLLNPDVLGAALGINQPAIVGPVVEHVREGVPEDSAILRQGTPVDSRDGRVGVVDHVLFDPERRHVTHFVVRRGVLGKSVIVPVDWVTSISDDRVFVDVGKEQLEQLPEFKPDADAVGLPAMEPATYEHSNHDAQSVEGSGRAEDDAAESTGGIDARSRLRGESDSAAGATTGLDYTWVDRFMFKTTGLHLSASQAEQVVKRAEQKLFDFFTVAEDTALANGRAVIYWHDLPLTKGFQATIRDYERFTRELGPVEIEAYLRTVGISNHLDLEVRDGLPRLFGAFLILAGRIIVLLTPRGLSHRERLEWLTRSETNRPVEGELERAAKILDLSL